MSYRCDEQATVKTNTVKVKGGGKEIGLFPFYQKRIEALKD